MPETKLADLLNYGDEDVEVLKHADEIFKPGSVVSIKHSSIFEFVLSVIQRVEGQNIYFRLPEAFLTNNIMKGDKISCHIMKDDNEFVIHGIISEIDIKYPWIVDVVAEKIVKFKNNRKSKRHLVNFPSKMYSNELYGNVYAIIKNISSIGISAVFREKIELGKLINVYFSISVDKFTSLEFKAKPVRVIDRSIYYEYGFEIVDIDDINKDLLDRLLYKLECNEAEFVTENLK